MKYTGVIIEESLADTSVLDKVKILGTQVEKVTRKHCTPWVKTWTLHTVEIAESDVDIIADVLQWSFDPTHPQWYADYKNDIFHYIIYNGQIFKVKRSDLDGYEEARQYGISIGIPEYQVDFAPHVIHWKR